MRIMQIGHSHYDYLKYFSRRFNKLNTHADLMRAYENDYYWCCHTHTPALARMGHETFLCVPTEIMSQRLWCEEHGLTMDDSGMGAMLKQIDWFKPDILYISSPAMFHDGVLDQLRWRPPFIAGWHATITRPHMHFTNYDLILSSHEECLLMASQQGARHTAMAYPGIPADLAEAFTPVKRTDICFSGYWAVSHPRRNQFLYELAIRAPSLPVNCAYYLGFYPDGPPCPQEVQRYNRGPVWGQSMFKAFAATRIVLNGYASINFGPQNLSPNMRQLEAMGMGSFLLTEQSDNLAAFFTEGQDLETYASTDELVEKALYYLEHADAREAIAAHGRATCQRYYTMDIRARALLNAVKRIQQADAAPTLAAVWASVHAVREAADGPGAKEHRNDVHRVLTQATDLASRLLLAGSVADGLALLADLEELPAIQDDADIKHLRLCRGLRAAYHKDVPEAARLFRAELDLWPEQDDARHCLSRLIQQKPLY